ncbi:MAG: NAD+ synthase [Rhodospirillales bacterium]
MTQFLTIAMAQGNPVVGDVSGNAARLLAARAQVPDADLLVSGELEISGYPPEDLVLKSAFLEAVEAAVRELAAATRKPGPALLVGAPWRDEGRVMNAALLLDEGDIQAIRFKHLLPNYSVFDEKRVFTMGDLPEPVLFRGRHLGVMICEDLWQPSVSKHLADAGAEILIALNGSPYEVDKARLRVDVAAARARECGLPVLYTNLVGGQDELVFDGGGFVLDALGDRRLQQPWWREVVTETRWTIGPKGWAIEASGTPADFEPLLPSVYAAIQLGLRDYVRKNGFPGVVLGLSGGIDSALSAAVAVDALGADKVRMVMMPSPFTSEESLEDAAEVGRLLGVPVESIGIQPAMEAFKTLLSPAFQGRDPDITEENIQARARGLVLMALSNKFGPMLLTTGNKSEMSVGYATLYGDMCGGYSVLKDIYKTTVFALSRWRNGNRPDDALGPNGAVMPERVITKPPTAELRPDQKDEDSLPPYAELDSLLHLLIEDEKSIDDAIVAGHDPATARRVWRLVDRAEYKRRQAPPGVKISKRAFGRERRYPITNGFTNLI